MSMARKWYWILIVGSVLLLLFAACAPPAPAEPAAPSEEGEAAAEVPASEGEEDVLRVWITWGDNPAQLQSLFDRYGEANNVRVEVNAPVDYDKVIAGLSGSEPPDILVTGSAEQTGTWVREGLITAFDDFLDGGKVDVEDIFDAPLKQCLYQGKYYCLPWGTDTYALFWNKDLFEEAGLDPEQPPTTLEELAEFARLLTKTDENGNVTQVGFIPDFSWSHLDQFAPMMGGYWYNDDGTELTLTSQPIVDAMKWQQQFYCDYDVDEILRFSSSFGGYMSPDNGFYSGKIAMQLEGEWQPGPNFIQSFAPELYYGVAPLPPPAANPERANTNLVGGTVVMIPSGVEDKEAAWDLLAWMVSPEILAEEMVVNFNLPTSGEAAKDPRFHENEKFEVFLNLMADPNARANVVTPINAEVITALDQIQEEVLHSCADPLPLLEEAQARLQPELDAALAN